MADDGDMRAALEEMLRSGAFTRREEKLLERLLAKPSASIKELFEIAARFGMYGNENLRAYLKAGALTPEDAKKLKKQHANRYATMRKKQQYVGPVLAQLNRRFRKHGVAAQVRPGKLKQTYALHTD